MISELFSLHNRVALITGGSKGIGKSIARGLAEAGANVLISARNVDELKSAACEIGAGLSVQVEWIACDMGKREAVDQLAAEAEKRMGRVDILVSNAGSNIPQAIDEIQDDAWDQLLELNLSSSMRLSRQLVPAMKKRGWGRIIYVSSILGIGSKERRSAYSATKAALIGMAQSAALDLGAFNITVNCLCPGPVSTDLPMNLLSEVEKQSYANRTALNRWGQPREMVGPVLLLASEAGAYITGTTLVVDGGALARAL